MRRVACVLALSLVVGCGEEAKVPGVATAYVSQATREKASRGAAARAGEAQTAMVNGEAAKGIASLTPGEPMSGLLAVSDPQLTDGKYFDAWLFELPQNSDVTITLASSAFDTYLTLFEGAPGASVEALGSNDDAVGTNSELAGSLRAGTYTAVASSYLGGATGAYEITVRAAPVGGGVGRILEAGRPGTGDLTTGDGVLPAGEYYQTWSFSGREGDRVTISLASADFDTKLGVLIDGELLVDNDDSGGTTNSQVTFYLPWSATYTAVVTSYQPAVTGSYEVSMTSAPRPRFTGFGSGGDPNGRYALLVGISDYPGDEDDLLGPVVDTRLVHALLVERFGFNPANIVTLNDADATRANIAQGIAQHLGQAGPNGVAVLYYSGHGAQVGDNIGITGALDPEPSGQDQALVVYGPPDISSALLDEELGYLIETLQAGRTLVLVDACFSGEITRGAAQSRSIDLSDPATAARVRLPRNFITSELRAIDVTDLSLGFGDFARIAEVLDRPQRHLMWSAATDLQQSWTSVEYLTGAFTTILDRRLRSEPGTSTFSQVHRLVHDEVVGHTGNHPTGEMELQNPQLRGDRQSMTIDDFFRQR